MNREVNLTKRIKTSKGLRYCPVQLAANGRIKPDFILIDGKPERHPEGAYYIEWRQNGKRCRLSVGKNAADADAQRQRKESELNALSHGIQVVPEKGQNSTSLAAAVADYLDEIKLTKKPSTSRSYSVALSYFLESCRKPNLEDIDRLDLLKFIAFLRDKKKAAHTIANKFTCVMIFLKAQGIKDLLRRNDAPVFTEEEAEIYEPEDLEKLFAVCTEAERTWFRFFLMTGMRDQEVRYCYWSDVNFNTGTVRVSPKPDRGWTPKAYRGREIPIPTELVAILRRWKAKGTNGDLLFPTRSSTPKHDFLFSLKKAAKRAKLNPDKFWLHRFRATFATTHLQSGVDLRTVMEWMGSKSMKSMLRYLKPARSKEMRARVNDTFKKFSAVSAR